MGGSAITLHEVCVGPSSVLGMQRGLACPGGNSDRPSSFVASFKELLIDFAGSVIYRTHARIKHHGNGG